MKAPVGFKPEVAVNPTTTTVYEARLEAWDTLGIHVKNTGAQTVSLQVCTKQRAEDDWAVRDVDAFLSLAAGDVAQFDADAADSMYVGLIGTAAGAGSTVDLAILFRRVIP